MCLFCVAVVMRAAFGVSALVVETTIIFVDENVTPSYGSYQSSDGWIWSYMVEARGNTATILGVERANWFWTEPETGSLNVPESFPYRGENILVGGASGSMLMSCNRGGIRAVTIPSGFCCIEDRTFQDCTGLERVRFSRGIETIGVEAFSSCAMLASLELPFGCKSIGSDAFRGCVALTSLKMPYWCKSIGACAFSGCTALSGLELNDGLESIGAHAFYGCIALREVNVPPSVTNVAYGAFWGCENVESAMLPSCLEESSLALVFGDACETIRSVRLHDGWKKVSGRLFEGCRELGDVTISDTVKTVDRRAFCDCVPEGGGLYDASSVPGLVLVDGWVVEISDALREECGTSESFAECVNVLLRDSRVRGVASGLFENEYRLHHVSLPPCVKYVGDRLFAGCLSLEQVDVPDGIEGIGESAFESCISMTDFHIPDSVTEVGRNAFAGCEFTDVSSIPGLELLDGWILKDIGVSAILSRNGAFDGEYVISMEQGIRGIADGAFAGTRHDGDNGELSGLSGVASLVIGEGVTVVGAEAFAFCDDLTNVYISASVERIGEHAFFGCKKLRHVYLPDTLEGRVPDSAFWSNESSPVIEYYETPREDCEICFDSNFEGGCKTIFHVGRDRAIGSPAVPSRDGFLFAGWFTHPTDGVRVNENTPAAGNMSYYAHWLSIGELMMEVEETIGGEMMKVTVRRVGGSVGRIAAKFKTQDSATVGGINGLSGRDFAYVKEYLVWEDGDASDRVVYVPTYVTDADGAVTLRLKLSVQTTGGYADCETPTLASGGKVVASIMPADKGSVVFATLGNMSVTAGNTLKVTIRRTGGSAGHLAVKFKTQDANVVGGMTAVAGVEFQYVNRILEWRDGDMSDRIVEIPTHSMGWVGDARTFRLKLSALTTGDYAGCVTPTIPNPKVVASVESNDAIYPGEVRITEMVSVPNCFKDVCPLHLEKVYGAPWHAYAGGAMDVVVSRRGGSAGRIAVKIKTQDASMVKGVTAFFNRDLEYANETLVWEDGEAGDKYFTVFTTYRPGYYYPRTFRLKLSAQTTGGYEGYAVPDIPEPKPIVSLWK